MTTRFPISRPTVYAWIEKGLPVIRVGRRVMFDERDVTEFLEKQKEVKQ